MIQFNLLPWREQKKREQKIIFAILLAASCVLGIFLLMIIRVAVEIEITRQEHRNDYLQSVIDQESAELFTLNGKKKILQKMDTDLDYLEDMRRKSVHAITLLDTLPRLMPESVTLNRLALQGNKITLNGKSVSSMQVTLLMENMEKSAVFLQPVLTEISARESLAGEEKFFQIEATQRE